MTRIPFGLAAALVCSLARAAPLAVPGALQGAGSGEVVINVPNVWGQTDLCGFGAGYYGRQNDTHCAASAVSNSFTDPLDQRAGSSSGVGEAYTDAAGVHVYTYVTGVGYAGSYADVHAMTGDRLYNPTAQPLQFTLSFHVDGMLSANGAGGTYLFITQSPLYGNPVNSWNFQLPEGQDHAQFAIDQTLTTLPITIAPGGSASWELQMRAYSQLGPLATPIGDSSASTNAGHTLSITGMALFDADGKPMPLNTLNSQYGWSYASSVPEAPTLAMMIAGLGVVALRCRQRRSS